MIDIEKAIAVVILNAQLDEIADTDRIDERREWLDEMSGLLPGTTTKFYRPYFVTAWHYWLLPENNLISGEGAKFDQNMEVCRRFILRQRMIDIKNELTIPLAYNCDTLLGTINADCQKCNDPIESQTNILSIMGF